MPGAEPRREGSADHRRTDDRRDQDPVEERSADLQEGIDQDRTHRLIEPSQGIGTDEADAGGHEDRSSRCGDGRAGSEGPQEALRAILRLRRQHDSCSDGPAERRQDHEDQGEVARIALRERARDHRPRGQPGGRGRARHHTRETEPPGAGQLDHHRARRADPDAGGASLQSTTAHEGGDVMGGGQHQTAGCGEGESEHDHRPAAEVVGHLPSDRQRERRAEDVGGEGGGQPHGRHSVTRSVDRRERCRRADRRHDDDEGAGGAAHPEQSSRADGPARRGPAQRHHALSGCSGRRRARGPNAGPP